MTAMTDAPRIALVHALPEAMTPIKEALAKDWPQANVFNLLDDSLSRDLAADGRITEAMTQRFVTLTRYAVGTGARAVQFTCSAFNECIETARAAVEVPVLKPDEAMIDDALTYGPRLGVVVSFQPSIASVAQQIDYRAVAMGVFPQVDVRLAEGALDALRAGDPAEHDRIVAAAAASLDACDAVMLAQYSMARAAPKVKTPARWRRYIASKSC
jgi:Asp/Glu/hydantoin racemase